MCLYPKLIENKKYKPTKKNNYKPPAIEDGRLKYITAACGKCLECRKQKARGWQIRMIEEQKERKNGIFITLTFNEESYNEIKDKVENKEDDNEIATKAARLCLERIRKETKKSVRHWLITEKGHTETKRIHIHGIVWNDKAKELIEKHWKYGFVYIGKYVNEKTINYVVKYITKPDLENTEFNGKILCSSGIGAKYMESKNAKNNKYKGEETNQTYRLESGARISMPTYYRNKIYTEEEREELWKQRLDEGKVWICGEEVDINDEQAYSELLKFHRNRATEIYRYEAKKWEEEKYKKQLRKQREHYKNEKRKIK